MICLLSCEGLRPLTMTDEEILMKNGWWGLIISKISVTFT